MDDLDQQENDEEQKLDSDDEHQSDGKQKLDSDDEHHGLSDEEYKLASDDEYQSDREQKLESDDELHGQSDGEQKIESGNEQKLAKGGTKTMDMDATLWAFEFMNISKPMEEGLKVDQAYRATRKKLPIRCPQTMQTRSNKAAPINIPSPTLSEKSNSVQLIFEISNSHVTMVKKGEGQLRIAKRNVARSRLNSRAEIEFTSTRFKLSVAIDEPLLKAIFVDKASTRTMNLFGIWMENMLPCTILEKVLLIDSMWYSMTSDVRLAHLSRFFAGTDVSKLELCFFPIICRGHWSLFVVYVNKDKRVPRLRGKKSYLLYLDSLGLTNPKECLESLHSALKCLAPHVDDSTIQSALYDPGKELELKIVEVPRQSNSSDCGFYVMTFMRYLIAGILQDGIGKT